MAQCLGSHTKRNNLDPTEDTTLSAHVFLGFSHFPCFWWPPVLGKAFYRKFLNEFDWVSLISRIWDLKTLRDFERMTTEDSATFTPHQGYIFSTWLTSVDVNLDHRAKVLFAGLCTVKLHYCTLWNEVSVYSLHLRRVELCFCFLNFCWCTVECRVVLVSAVQQGQSVIPMHKSTLS